MRWKKKKERKRIRIEKKKMDASELKGGIRRHVCVLRKEVCENRIS